MKLYLFTILSTLLLCISLIQAKLVMVINAAEGEKDNLSSVGLARAQCLKEIFGVNGTFTAPQKIFAQSGKSKRQQDTVMPLAQSLNLQVDLTYSNDKVKELVNGIVTAKEDVILVSWSHDKMDKIARNFEIISPPNWDKNVYDEIWIFTDGAVPYLKQENAQIQSTNYKGDHGYGMIVVKENVEQCMANAVPAGSSLPASSASISKAHINTIIGALLLIIYVVF